MPMRLLDLPDAELERARPRDFPFFARKVFLSHASVSPLPTRAVEATCEYARSLGEQGQFEPLSEPLYARAKERIARLLGPEARPEEIAFAGSTSAALGLVASSLPWRAGDNCVVFEGDFPANVVVWKNLEPTRGVEVRVVPFRPARDWTPRDIEPLLDERTRVVTLSALNFLSGQSVDIAAFATLCRERGVLLCVDAIQGFGALDLPWTHADFVCADAHKWMLGPNGTAFLWARPEPLETMRPQVLGWLAIEGRDDWFSYGTTPIAGAQRFEPGARGYLGIVATEAALALLEDEGIEAISARVTHLRELACQELTRHGLRLHHRPDPSFPGGIVSFGAPDQRLTPALHEHLSLDFELSLRSERGGAPWIRVSPHFMNVPSDIERLAASAASFLRRRAA